MRAVYGEFRAHNFKAAGSQGNGFFRPRKEEAMTSTYFTNDDLILIEALLATLPAAGFLPCSIERTGAVHFLLDRFHDTETIETGLGQRLSVYCDAVVAMKLSLAAWQDEGGATAASVRSHR